VIEAEKANFDITRMCELLGVSRSGFYDWQQRQAVAPGPRVQRREELEVAITQAHAASDGVYGAPRITAELRAAGHTVTRKTVAKIMAGLGIQGISPRPFRTTTRPDQHRPPHPDLVNRVFDTGTLDRVWVSDITYLRTGQGWLYLAVVRDACSRRVLGWAIEDHIRDELVLTALTMAVRLRGHRPHRVILHADRGCQYTSAAVVTYARAHNIACSVGRTGVCWDNAMAESFWATLKIEFYYRRSWPTKAEAKHAVATWIRDVYNTRRRHSALGMLTPLQFELHAHTTAAQAA
jgi:putative transposase